MFSQFEDVNRRQPGTAADERKRAHLWRIVVLEQREHSGSLILVSVPRPPRTSGETR